MATFFQTITTHMTSRYSLWKRTRGLIHFLEATDGGTYDRSDPAQVLVIQHLAREMALSGLDSRTAMNNWLEKFTRDTSLVPQKGYCTICNTSSQYDICLPCEREHQMEIQRVRLQNHRAKKANEPCTLTIREWLHILSYYQYHCAYCQTGPYECMEHFIPIGQGQKDGGTTAKNVAPSCIKCNTQKSNKHPGL